MACGALEKTASISTNSIGSAGSWLAGHFPRHCLGQLNHRHGEVASPVVAIDGIEAFRAGLTAGGLGAVVQFNNASAQLLQC